MQNLNIAFFGSRPLALPVLEELEAAGFLPSLVITEQDRPMGRKKVMTPPEVKTWALERDIEVLQPETLKNGETYEVLMNSDTNPDKRASFDLFIVASFGMLLPKALVEKPRYKTLNVHPSLLPKLRGPSPVRSAILRDEKESVGVTIIQLDEHMDHGPIIAQASIELESLPESEGGGWPVAGDLLEKLLAHAGGELLSEILPDWIEGNITPEAQNDADATFCKKLQKEDGLIKLDDDPYQNWLKIQAYKGWPGTYFLAEKNGLNRAEGAVGRLNSPNELSLGQEIRVKITDAAFKGGVLEILKVIPEGKKEMAYSTFLQGT